MVRMKMNRDTIGYPDGVTKTEYKEGMIYDLPESLAESFKIMGSGVLVEKKYFTMKERLEIPENPKVRKYGK